MWSPNLFQPKSFRITHGIQSNFISLRGTKGRKNNIYHDPPHEISRLFSSLSISTLPHFEVLEGSECLPTCPETSVHLRSWMPHAVCKLGGLFGFEGAPASRNASSSVSGYVSHTSGNQFVTRGIPPLSSGCAVYSRVINVGFRGGAWGLPFTLLGLGQEEDLGTMKSNNCHRHRPKECAATKRPPKITPMSPSIAPCHRKVTFATSLPLITSDLFHRKDERK